VQELDWVVGELLGKLDELGIADDTVRPEPPTATNPGVSVASRPGAQDAQRPSTGSGTAALPSHLYAQSENDWLPAQ
jgi:hypothetical protein